MNAEHDVLTDHWAAPHLGDAVWTPCFGRNVATVLAKLEAGLELWKTPDLALEFRTAAMELIENAQVYACDSRACAQRISPSQLELAVSSQPRSPQGSGAGLGLRMSAIVSSQRFVVFGPNARRIDVVRFGL